MEVILLERIAKLGQMGDVVRVRDGFARNFLLPKGKALRATKDNRGKFETMKSQLEARNLEQKSEAEKNHQQDDGTIRVPEVLHPFGAPSEIVQNEGRFTGTHPDKRRGLEIKRKDIAVRHTGANAVARQVLLANAKQEKEHALLEAATLPLTADQYELFRLEILDINRVHDRLSPQQRIVLNAALETAAVMANETPLKRVLMSPAMFPNAF